MFVGGIGASTLLWFLFIRRNMFLAVLEHELTHMLTALLLLKIPINLHASHQEGGEVQWRGPQFGNWLVTLAPYFLPTPTVLLLAFGWMVSEAFMPTYIGMLGFTTGFNLWSTLKETRFSQPDLQKYPQWFNLSILISGNLLFTGMVLGFVASAQGQAKGGYRGVWVFLNDSWEQTLELPRFIGTWLT